MKKLDLYNDEERNLTNSGNASGNGKSSGSGRGLGNGTVIRPVPGYHSNADAGHADGNEDGCGAGHGACKGDGDGKSPLKQST